MQRLFQVAIRRVRQHHAIEHATIHVLSKRHPDRSYTGLSDPFGFSIYGEINADDLRTAVGDAMVRLQGGERELAIHNNCGTNLLTTALSAAFAGMIARMIIRKGWLERLASTIVLTLLAVIVSKPLGFRVQEYTTLADVEDRTINDISLVQLGTSRLLRVNFE